MLMLASLLSLMAAGAAAVVTFEDEDVSPETDEDAEQQDSEGTISEDQAARNLMEMVGVTDPATDEDETGLSSENAQAQIISGGEDAETITGEPGDDQINGYDGDDTLAGLEGDDHLYGNSGDDLLMGGGGADLLHGEDGDDQMQGDDGDDTLFGHFGDDLMSGGHGMDSLQGGFGADSLFGDGGDDALHGGYDDDVLTGGEGEDTLFGGAGDDLLDGTDTQLDFLNGSDGDDTLVAGQGDILSGGDGSDSFVLTNWQSGAEGVTIMDFDSAEDQLVFLLDDEGDEPPELEIRHDPDAPHQSGLFLNDEQVALIHTVGEMSSADIAYVPAQGSAVLQALRS